MLIFCLKYATIMFFRIFRVRARGYQSFLWYLSLSHTQCTFDQLSNGNNNYIVSYFNSTLKSMISSEEKQTNISFKLYMFRLNFTLNGSRYWAIESLSVKSTKTKTCFNYSCFWVQVLISDRFRFSYAYRVRSI